MSVDWDTKVLAPCADVFGEPVTYTPQEGVPFQITGIYDEAYREVILLDGVPMTTESPVLGVRLAEFPEGRPPRKADQLSIASVNAIFTIKDVRLDGHGHAKLMLNHKSAIS